MASTGSSVRSFRAVSGTLTARGNSYRETSVSNSIDSSPADQRTIAHVSQALIIPCLFTAKSDGSKNVSSTGIRWM